MYDNIHSVMVIINYLYFRLNSTKALPIIDTVCGKILVGKIFVNAYHIWANLNQSVSKILANELQI